jgi:hypothetical protein
VSIAPGRDPKTGQFLVGPYWSGWSPQGFAQQAGRGFPPGDGSAAIEQCRKLKPEAYVRVIASLLPQQLEIKESTFDGISDEQLATIIAAARASLGICEPSEVGVNETAH